MTEFDQSLQVGDQDHFVQLRFFQNGDRFGHRFEIGSNARSILSSVEGSDSDVWPVGAALQELHYESRDDSEIIFGVGMSGDSHYSLSAASNRRDTIRMEFACRYKSDPVFLGSTYAWESSGGVNLLNNAIFELQTPDGKSELSTTIVSDGQAELVVRNYSTLPSPATLIWGFEIVTRM